MGQLDEAIRAHLDLKRKHGASEEELQAEEQEALGPVRREAPSPPAAEGSADVDLEDETAARAEPTVDGSEAYEEPPGDFEPQGFSEPDPQAFTEPEPQALSGSADPLDERDLELEPEPLDPLYPADPLDSVDSTEPLEPAEPEAEPLHGDTPPRGFEAVEDPELDDEEDVLEETPDFLQETPEHDRLWFEQKPPRDFDFDE